MKLSICNKLPEFIQKAIASHGYCMVNDETEIAICDDLCDKGLLVRGDKAGNRCPVNINTSYTYILPEEKL